MAPQQRLRVYQTWTGHKGEERFFCYGYLVSGPNWKSVFGSALLIAAPTGIFLAFVAPYLMRQLSIAIMVFACLLPFLSISFLFCTSCREPGIIPRQEPDKEWLAGRKPRTKEVLVNGQKVVVRYNDTCHFYQPPRAHHCSVNDNCVEKFDHHCPWVGTTIGLRNYRTFLLFIITSTILCLYVFGCCLAFLFLRHNELVAQGSNNAWGQALLDSAPAIAILIVTFVFVWFVGGLSGFHCYLVATNQTTYENFRYNNDNRVNPYDEGLVRNCMQVWCNPVPSSKVDFRAFLETSSVGDVEDGQGGGKEGSIARHSLPPQPQPLGNGASSSPPNPMVAVKPLSGASTSSPGGVGHVMSESRENASLGQLKTQLEEQRAGARAGASSGGANGATSLHASLREIEPAIPP